MLKYSVHIAIIAAFCIADFTGCRRNDKALTDGNILQVPLSSEISTLILLDHTIPFQAQLYIKGMSNFMNTII